MKTKQIIKQTNKQKVSYLAGSCFTMMQVTKWSEMGIISWVSLNMRQQKIQFLSEMENMEILKTTMGILGTCVTPRPRPGALICNITNRTHTVQSQVFVTGVSPVFWLHANVPGKAAEMASMLSLMYLCGRAGWCSMLLTFVWYNLSSVAIWEINQWSDDLSLHNSAFQTNK